MAVQDAKQREEYWKSRYIDGLGYECVWMW